MIPVSTGNVLLQKSIKVFSKPSGLKYDSYTEGYINYFNRIILKKQHLVVKKC